MTWYEIVRVVVGAAIGLGLATLPFLHYGACTQHHEQHASHAPPHQR
jgi:hypothetical protein